jgi:hypothetical protein
MFRICFGFVLCVWAQAAVAQSCAAPGNLAEIPGLWSRHTMPIARAVDVVNWPN